MNIGFEFDLDNFSVWSIKQMAANLKCWPEILKLKQFFKLYTNKMTNDREKQTIEIKNDWHTKFSYSKCMHNDNWYWIRESNHSECLKPFNV